MTPLDHLAVTVAYLAARLRLGTHADDGLTTTELAVLTFLLVGGALVVGGIIFNAAKNNANAIPDPTQPTP
jgi:ABC-type enterobactin transport system permease subunit